MYDTCFTICVLFTGILIVFSINYILVNDSDLRKRSLRGCNFLFQISSYSSLQYVTFLSQGSWIIGIIVYIQLLFFLYNRILQVLTSSFYDEYMHIVSLQESRHSQITTQSVVMLMKLDRRHTGGCEWRGEPRRRAG